MFDSFYFTDLPKHWLSLSSKHFIFLMTLSSIMCICACEGMCTNSGSCVGQERVLDSWSCF